ncbi:VOC family protein [Mesorhizobium sp. KR9-304]|uniref:VOC family protein n=1 Tax=Mesorhizobium sp. KR9-304 TaxID=3156614 RepID=UPI0032B468A0
MTAASIYPTFRYRSAEKMIDWLCEAFGFAVDAKFTDGKAITHAELSLGGAIIMLGEVRDDAYGGMVGGPGSPGGKSTYIAVDDIDALHAKAKAAGAKILEEPVDRDHGSRDFICADPQGNVWSFGTYRPKAK